MDRNEAEAEFVTWIQWTDVVGVVVSKGCIVVKMNNVWLQKPFYTVIRTDS